MKYLYLDANSLRYAYRSADNTRMLDVFARTAKAMGYELAITDVVRLEVAETGDAHARAILAWMDRNTRAFQTREARLYGDHRAGRLTDYDPADKGERSILERMTQDEAEGRMSAACSDDHLLHSPRTRAAGTAPPARTIRAFRTAHMLNMAATGWLDGTNPQPIINAEEYAAFQRQLSELKDFKGPAAQGDFLRPYELEAAQAGKPALRLRMLRYAGKTLVVAGTVMLAVDALTTAAEAAVLAEHGDSEGAAKAVTAFAGRLGGAIEFAEVGLVLGGPAGAILGAVVGAAIGEEAVREVWRIVERAGATAEPEAPSPTPDLDPRLTDDSRRDYADPEVRELQQDLYDAGYDNAQVNAVCGVLAERIGEISMQDPAGPSRIDQAFEALAAQAEDRAPALRELAAWTQSDDVARDAPPHDDRDLGEDGVTMTVEGRVLTDDIATDGSSSAGPAEGAGHVADAPAVDPPTVITSERAAPDPPLAQEPAEPHPDAHSDGADDAAWPDAAPVNDPPPALAEREVEGRLRDAPQDGGPETPSQTPVTTPQVEATLGEVKSQPPTLAPADDPQPEPLASEAPASGPPLVDVEEGATPAHPDVEPAGFDESRAAGDDPPAGSRDEPHEPSQGLDPLMGGETDDPLVREERTSAVVVGPPPPVNGALHAEPPFGLPPEGASPEGDPLERSPPEEDPPEYDPPDQYPPEGDPPLYDPPEQDPPEGDPPEDDPPDRYPPEGDPPEDDPPEDEPPDDDPPEDEETSTYNGPPEDDEDVELEVSATLAGSPPDEEDEDLDTELLEDGDGDGDDEDDDQDSDDQDSDDQEDDDPYDDDEPYEDDDEPDGGGYGGWNDDDDDPPIEEPEPEPPPIDDDE